MHQSIQTPVQAPSATVPAQPSQPTAQHQSSLFPDQTLDNRKLDSQTTDDQTPNRQAADGHGRDSQPLRLRSCAQLQHQTLQQGQDLSESLHQHNQHLEQLGEQSLSSWYRCRESASFTRQQAFAAVDRATTVDSEIAQLNRTIQQQLQQFDEQLKISTQTLQQEVAQKVGQYRRHIQQQSQQCRDRLRLAQAFQTGPRTPQLSPAQQLFQKTTLR